MSEYDDWNDPIKLDIVRNQLVEFESHIARPYQLAYEAKQLRILPQPESTPLFWQNYSFFGLSSVLGFGKARLKINDINIQNDLLPEYDSDLDDSPQVLQIADDDQEGTLKVRGETARRESRAQAVVVSCTSDVVPILTVLSFALKGNLPKRCSCQGQAPAAFRGSSDGI